MKIACLLTFACLLWLPTLTMAQTSESEKQFTAAKKALNRGDLTEFYALKQELAGHHLHAYLEYYYLQSSYGAVDAAIIQNFIETYPKSPMATKLLRKKLTDYAEAGNWQAFLKDYNPAMSNTRLKCYYIQALQMTKPESSVSNLIRPIWLSGKNRPSSCTPAFNLWLSNNSNKNNLIWERFQLSLKVYNFQLANYLITKMNDQQIKKAHDILKLYKTPNLVTNNSYLNKQPSAEVISYGIFRLARRNPSNAIKVYQRLSKRYEFNDQQKQRIFQAIALKFAMRKNKQSSTWFRKIVGYDLDPVYQEWLIRSALYHGHWNLVKSAINAMPKAEQEKPRWTYWYARALDKLGNKTTAQEIFIELAQTRSYHGFLASQHLTNKVEVKHEPLTISETSISQVKAIPAFKRAKSLHKLNQTREARSELYYLIKNSNKEQQYIIMKLVSDWGWHAQTLRLSHHAEHKDDLDLRFPLAYYDIVMKNANKRKVDPALIYAIMRQESYFMEKAGSHAGAIGLMQLMPATAHKTSKQYRLKYSGREDLLNGKTNIKFGTAHLNKLHEQFKDHPILIIAAYNAGKRAVYRWMPKGKRVPADIWIETVPFHETRNYIKNVVAGYIVYQFRLGQKPDLESIMRVVR